MPTRALGEQVAEMIAAYSDEIAAARVNVASHPLSGGRVRTRAERHAVIEFPDPELDDVHDGDEVQVSFGPKAAFDADVLAARRGSIVLSVSGAVPGEWKGTATLRIDATALPKAVKRRLETLAEEPGAFSANDADRMLTSPATPFPKPKGDLREEFDGVLNEMQALAARSSLAEGTTYLWGPPGTGKTTTLAQVIAEHVRCGRRVLITSHTNAAVDLLLARAARALEENGVVRPGLLVRSGRCTPELREAYDGVLTPEGALKAMGFGIEYGLLLDLAKAIDKAKHARARLDRRGLDDATAGWDARITELEDLRTKLEERIGDLERSVVAEARVVATTAHRAATGKIERDVDVVIIDEASMVPVPLAWLVLGLGRTHATIAGDFRQLAPIVQARRASPDSSSADHSSSTPEPRAPSRMERNRPGWSHCALSTGWCPRSATSSAPPSTPRSDCRHRSPSASGSRTRPSHTSRHSPDWICSTRVRSSAEVGRGSTR